MNELSAFRISASKMRSSKRAFDGDFVSFKHDVGAWLAGKAKTDLSGRQLVADVHDLIVGCKNTETINLFISATALSVTVISRRHEISSTSILWQRGKGTHGL